MKLPGPIVGAGWLAQNLDRPDLCVIDVRWHLGGPPGLDEYLAGHIPGAVFVNLDTQLTGASGAGRHPLPGRRQFEDAMRGAGLSTSSAAVVYDDAGGSVAARLWWLLRVFGHPAVAVLDGGIAAWQGGLETGPVEVAAGDFRAAEPDRAAYLDYDQVKSSDLLLLDVRAPERYRGEVEPVDPRAGHIPGARSAFWKGALGPGGGLLPPEALRARFEALGVKTGSETAVYCGSGVNACHGLLALEVAGIEGARLYAGSWSDWSRRPGAPVATGESPGRLT